MDPRIYAIFVEAGINLDAFNIPGIEHLRPRINADQMNEIESRMDRCLQLQIQFNRRPDLTDSQHECTRLHLSGIMHELCRIHTSDQFINSDQEIQDDINYWEAKLLNGFDDESDYEEDDDEEQQNEDEDETEELDHEEGGGEPDEDYNSSDEENEVYYYRDPRRG